MRQDGSGQCVDAGTPATRRGPTLYQPARDMLSHAFDDPEIPLRCGSENLQRGLVRRTLIGGERAGKAVEFDHDDPLLETLLAGFDSVGCPHQGLAATGLDSGKRERAI